MEQLNALHVAAELGTQRLRQHRDTVAETFPFSDHDFPAREVDVFDAQPERFENAHARAIQELKHEPGRTLRRDEDTTYLVPVEHDRQAGRALRCIDAVQPRQF